MYMQNMHVYVHYIIYIVVEVSMTSLLEHSDVQPTECKIFAFKSFDQNLPKSMQYK